MNESFVFHADFIADLPSEYKARFIIYTFNYGIYGIIPQLDGLEQSIWIKIQKRIDTDKINYEIATLKKKINAINMRVKNDKATSNDEINLTSYNSKLNELNEVKLTNTYTPYVSDTVSVNESVSESVYVSDIVSVSEYESVSVYDNDIDASKMPDKNPPSQKILSDKIFNLLKDAHLPCCKNNPVTFYMTDYANGMRYLHSNADYKAIHSDDLIGAVENYIRILKDDETYITSKMNFYSLVKSKLFYNLLPANFNAENYKKFGSDKAEEKEDENRSVCDLLCPKCNQKSLYYIGQKCYCEKCGEITMKELYGYDIGEEIEL